MFENIKRNVNLREFIVDECCDNGICLELEDNIPDEDKLIIKVDDYYNAQHMGNNTPPSPDCLILIRCNDGGYSLHVAELKNIKSSKGYDVKNMLGKFDTCFYDFIQSRFPELFNVDYKAVKLYFVSKIDVYSRDMGLSYDLLMAHRIRFNGKKLNIRAFMPTPKVKHCY